MCWAAAALCAAAATRAIGAPSTVAWAMGLGLAVAAPLAIAFGDASVTSDAFAWLAVSGIANVGGLLLQYAAYKRGKTGLVTQICATEGAIAAVLAALAGEHIAPGTVALLAAITAGVVLATAHDDQGQASGVSWIALAVGAALLFGINLLALSEAGQLSSAFVAIVPARLVGVVAVLLPLASARRLRSPVAVLPLIAIVALGEVVGVLSYAAGAQANTAIAAVVASQFGALAVVGALLLDGERLRRRQLVGLVIVSASVAGLAAASAGG